MQEKTAEETVKVPVKEMAGLVAKAERAPALEQREGLVRSLLRRRMRPPVKPKPKPQRTAQERTRDQLRKKRRVAVREARRVNRVKNWKKHR